METKTYSRRAFLNRLWAIVGSLAILEAIAVLVAFFRPRRPKAGAPDGERLVEAGSVDRFVPGTVTAFVQGKFYLARLEDGGFMALSRRCTHLGCTVPWVSVDHRFVCPCHSSAFDIRGAVVSPPAPRALDLYPVNIENDRVVVDTSRLLKRSGFSSDQVTYPDST
jgi:cytochrome b6-f complex iron-sulfur subunit